MSSLNKLQIIAEPGKEEFFIFREFEVPRELVFKAFSDPDIFAELWGPDDSPTVVDYYHFKKGGSYRYRNLDPNGNELCAFSGIYHEVTFPERIIQTSEFEGLPEPGHVILEAFIFEELSGNRTKLTIHDVCRSIADRDGMISAGMDTGLQQGFNRLDKILQKEYE